MTSRRSDVPDTFIQIKVRLNGAALAARIYAVCNGLRVPAWEVLQGPQLTFQ